MRLVCAFMNMFISDRFCSKANWLVLTPFRYRTVTIHSNNIAKPARRHWTWINEFPKILPSKSRRIHRWIYGSPIEMLYLCSSWPHIIEIWVYLHWGFVFAPEISISEFCTSINFKWRYFAKCNWNFILIEQLKVMGKNANGTFAYLQNYSALQYMRPMMIVVCLENSLR